MNAYYNEHDPFSAAWLKQLIRAGHLAPGEVDERSIRDVRPEELRGFTQCHFFAGIGVWSYALRRAGWEDDRPVWTGSCPCQPFSLAGRKAGLADERHLWPTWFQLIRESRPLVIFSEQVSSQGALAWFDVVSADLEGTGYAVGATDCCAAGFGAPHLRQRLYFVAHQSGNGRREECSNAGRFIEGNQTEGWPAGFVSSGAASELADADECPNLRGISQSGKRSISTSDEGMQTLCARRPGATNGFWADAEWLPCVDGKARAIEPGTFPLADGAPRRLGRLRGYGNALVAPQAQAFIEAYLEVTDEPRYPKHAVRRR